MVTLKWSLVFDKIPSLLHGCAVTMEISVLTLIFGTILGVILALMRDSHIKVIARLAQLYIWIWRGTPLMVQAFLIYFGLPNLGITLSAMTAGTLSMSLNTGAYIAAVPLLHPYGFLLFVRFRTHNEYYYTTKFRQCQAISQPKNKKPRRIAGFLGLFCIKMRALRHTQHCTNSPAEQRLPAPAGEFLFYRSD